MTLGEKILKLRKTRGWSQEDLAGRIGVTRQALSRWESDAAVPDTVNVVELADLFGVSCDYLLREKWTEDRPQPLQQSRWTEWQMAGGLLTLLGAIGTLITLILGFVMEPGYHAKVIRWWAAWTRNDLLWVPILCWILFLIGLAMMKKWNAAAFIEDVLHEASPKKIRQDLGMDEEDTK